MSALDSAFAATETVATALWVGASTGFAILSPITFRATENRDVFAGITEKSIARLAKISNVAGGVAILAALAQRKPARALAGAGGLALVNYQQAAIVPAMTAAQRALGSFNAVAEDDPKRIAYDTLHKKSTQVYGSALLLGYLQLALGALRR